MSKVLLTGIGNALVDIEFSVTEAEFAVFGVDKGTMTLTDPKRQTELLDLLANKEPRQSSGGSVANSVIAFAQFGGRSGFMSVLGSDSLGQFYAQEFKDLNIVLCADFVTSADTGSCIVLITPDAERTMNTTLAANLLYHHRMINEDVIKNSEWLLLEGYKLTEEDGAEALEAATFLARKHGVQVAVSCSDKFVVDVFADRMAGILRHADMVFCNELEACALAREEDPELAYRSLKSRFKNLALTRGTKGSAIHWYGTEAHIPAYAVETTDTTGAGDMYAGAFLYGALHGYRTEHAGRLASYAAAQVVSQYGARLKANHLVIRDSILEQSSLITK